MKAICYKNTKTTIPGWVDTVHIGNPVGYAYESNNHFVHLYGYDKGIYTISTGLTVLEKKRGTLEEWVKTTFGATNILKMKNNVGVVEKAIWRPGLYYANETQQALGYDLYDESNSEVKLKILLEKLLDILVYIEPTNTSMNVFGHKLRELLILSCTEVENHFLAILRKSNQVKKDKIYTTKDYIKLKDIAYLEEYSVKYKNYKKILAVIPFKNWNIANPTKSLVWYDAYNKTKHNSDSDFSSAKLKHVLNAVAANIILHCVRFGPYGLYGGRTIVSTYINQLVEISLNNPDITSFYIPKIVLPQDTREDLFCYDSYLEKHNKEWIRKNIKI